ncbi:MAG: hypothetical protein V1793_09435 [Pseudomonadota bacterium]
MLFPAAPVFSESPESIVGRWQISHAGTIITAQFNADGTFRQTTRSPDGILEYQGQWRLWDTLLQLMFDGSSQPQVISCDFRSADKLILSYTTGEVLEAHRLISTGQSAQTAAQPPARKHKSGAETPKPGKTSPSPDLAQAEQSPGRKLGPVLLTPVWEPNEQAFRVLAPQGWKIAGGVFNVNPMKMNGPGNTISPKCDFTVKMDDDGSVMVRWVPAWNYADLSLSPSGWSLFRPGQYYQGMPVRQIIGPRQFLMELLRSEHPRAADFKIIAEDPLYEVAQAYSKKAEATNSQLIRMGIPPTTFQSMAMVVEYREMGRLFRERIATTIADAHGSAYMWSNDDTVILRAPADEFDTLKPLLDTILSSRELNPQWVAAVTRAMGERARAAMETQQYINRTVSEIVENRRRTHAEIRHENWLFISGQDEYKNPFTGQVERGSSAFQYRWVNEKGEVLYCDENSFDPNGAREYEKTTWKRSPVWDRR